RGPVGPAVHGRGPERQRQREIAELEGDANLVGVDGDPARHEGHLVETVRTPSPPSHDYLKTGGGLSGQRLDGCACSLGGVCAPIISICDHRPMEVALVWQGVESPALELSTVEMGRETLTARGAWVRAEPEPYSLSYRLETSSGFVTTSLMVTAWGAGWSRTLDLRRRPEGAWVAQPGGDLPELGGALDCDLGYSCLTNTMPVLRHALVESGGPIDLLMAWVSVPDLRVLPVAQRYTHLARRPDGGAVVRYESGSFTADIAFDASGFVVDYPQLGRRV